MAVSLAQEAGGPAGGCLLGQLPGDVISGQISLQLGLTVMVSDTMELSWTTMNTPSPIVTLAWTHGPEVFSPSISQTTMVEQLDVFQARNSSEIRYPTDTVTLRKPLGLFLFPCL